MQIIKGLAILCLVLSTITVNSGTIDRDYKYERYHEAQEYCQIEAFHDLFISSIAYLKEAEGFSSELYLCPAGHLTIGYGKSVQDSSINHVTEEVAEVMLYLHFEDEIQYIERDLQMSRYDSPGKVLACALFIYNVGRGSWTKSAIRKSVKHDLDISGEIMKWVHIKKKKSKSLLKRRQFELNLYIGS